ncbi:MAG: dihydroneopterin aldolase [Nitrospirae bacterium]|nr:dihydroneopterin aldolase [Nitrospirota bacterium]
MAGKIIIERLEFHGRCGVTPEERKQPQPLAVDLELECQTEPAAISDDIHRAIDYAQIADRVLAVGATQNCALLETFAEHLLTMLFSEFPIEKAKILVRKLAPPLKHVTNSVGVQLERSRLLHHIQDPGPTPARFLTQQLHRLPKGKALDVAAGSGRNALYLAAQGFHVDAIDRDEETMTKLAATAKQHNLPNLTARTIDLERATDERPEFPQHEYDVIIVFFYLHRALFPALIESLKPNGVLLYETFLIDNYLRRHHPRRWEFCLAHNELLRLTSTLRVLSYDEGEHNGSHGPGSAFTAQLVAQQAGPSRLLHEAT